MPSIDDDQQPLSSNQLFSQLTTKKRRRDADHETVQAVVLAGDDGYHATHESWDGSWLGHDRPLTTTTTTTALTNITPRKIIPLPAMKRARIFEVSDDEQHLHHLHHHPSQPSHSPSGSYNDSRSPARPRPAVLSRSHTAPPPRVQPSAVTTTTMTTTTTTASTNLVSSKLLTPCHVCHRRPMRKSDLDSFAECEGCTARACYVCVRECLGWSVGTPHPYPTHVDDNTRSPEGGPRMDRRDHQGYATDGNGSGSGSDNNARPFGNHWLANGHRAVICSQCCVETGSEGDVLCYGCLLGAHAS